ncbi:MAG: tryptophan synthase subunit alpha [Proteobacteria bacterium]|nr:tryptophan synthase subunit alpha [Pseudomonadota bacterium]
MARYETMFARLRQQNEGAFVPFVVIGDPVPSKSLNIIRTLVEGGADALELGIPFSDPIADGPTIQAATVRALQAGTTPEQCFEIIKKVREEFPDIPIGLLVYANLVVSNGENTFYKRAADAGVDSVLVADVPVFEAEPFVSFAKKHAIEEVFIAPPNADEKLLGEVARLTQGYTYIVARPGVTGADEQISHQGNTFGQLKKLGAPPGLLGFGISKPAHVKAALEAGADGAISGSAVVRIVEKHTEDQTMLSELTAFVRSMKAATQREST